MFKPHYEKRLEPYEDGHDQKCRNFPGPKPAEAVPMPANINEVNIRVQEAIRNRPAAVIALMKSMGGDLEPKESDGLTPLERAGRFLLELLMTCTKCGKLKRFYCRWAVEESYGSNPPTVVRYFPTEQAAQREVDRRNGEADENYRRVIDSQG